MTQLLTGSFGSLEVALAAEVRAAKAADPLRRVTVVVGSGGMRARLGRELARQMGAHANLRLLTIHDLARELGGAALAAAGGRALSALARERLLVRLVRERGDDWYFAPVAAMPGLPAALARALNDLREACVTPVELRTHAAGRRESDLASLYAEYVAQLESARLYDDAGLYEAAVAAGLPSDDPFIFYGLYDFPEMQARLLRALAPRAQAILVPEEVYEGSALERALGEGLSPRELPRDEGAAALARLRTCLIASIRGARSAADAAARQPIVSAVGADAREAMSAPAAAASAPIVPASGADASLAIVSVPDAAGERALVLREVMTAATCGIRLHEMAVVASDRQSRETLAAALAAAGIKVAAQVRERRDQTVALGLLLECVSPAGGGDALRRAAVLELAAVAGGLGPGGSPQLVARWERLSRRARVVAGAREWRERLARERRRLEWRRANETADDDDAPVAGSLVGLDLEALAALEEFVAALAGVARGLPREGTWPQMTAALARAAERIGVALGESAADGAFAELRLLAALEAVESRVELSEYARVVRRVLDHLDENLGEAGREGVAVLSPHQVRGLAFDTVIVCDLVEGGLLARPPGDPVLLDADRERLATALGANIETAAARELQALPLFSLVLQAARRRAVLVHPRLDGANGSPRLPSRLLLAAATAFAGRPVPFAELDQPAALGGLVRRMPSMSVPPLLGAPPRDGDGAGASAAWKAARAAGAVAHEEACDEREYDLVALCDAGADSARSQYLGRLLGDDAAARRREALHAPNLPRLTAYDGRVQGGRAAAAAAAFFSAPVSPSAIQAYLTCPFRFYASYLLGMSVVDEPEVALEIEPADYGTLVHGILRDLFASAAADPGLGEAAALQLAPAIVRLAAERAEADGLTGFPLAWAVRREQLLADVLRAVRLDPSWSDGLRPAHLEWSFGASPAPAVELVLGSRTIRFKGRIDRLDRDDRGERLRLIDYKTGKGDRERTQLNKGQNVQLPVYRLAVAQLEAAVHAIACEFRLINRSAGFASLPLPGDADEILAGLETALGVAVGGIESGLYPRWRSGDGCAYCDLEPGCDATQWSLEIKLDDPDLDALKAFKQGGA